MVHVCMYILIYKLHDLRGYQWYFDIKYTRCNCSTWCDAISFVKLHIDGLVQERRNSTVNALGLRRYLVTILEDILTKYDIDLR